MRNLPLLDAERVRKITGSFSWLDHHLLHAGFVARMTREELLLYFFLVLVGDRHGMRFYSYDKICTLLKMDADTLVEARAGLIGQTLIAFDGHCYQVLQLPARPAPLPQARTPREFLRGGDFRALAEILEQARRT